MNDPLQLLQALLNEQQQAFNQKACGRATRLLLERRGKLDGQLIGKSPWLQSVHVPAPGLAIGDMVDVEITSAGPNSLGAKTFMEEVASFDPLTQTTTSCLACRRIPVQPALKSGGLGKAVALGLDSVGGL